MLDESILVNQNLLGVSTSLETDLFSPQNSQHQLVLSSSFDANAIKLPVIQTGTTHQKLSTGSTIPVKQTGSTVGSDSLTGLPANGASSNSTPPNLTVSSISEPTYTNANGKLELNFSYIINNIGGTNADPSQTKFYLSTNQTLDGSDIALSSTDSINSRPAGTSYSRNVSPFLTSLINPGDYYLIFHVDSENAVIESDENNIFATAQKLTIALPDLAIEGVSTNFSAKFGSTLTIDYTLENKGNGNANNSTIKFYLRSADGSSVIDLGEDVIASVQAGVNQSNSLSITLPEDLSLGNYFLYAQADGEDEVFESNENNNIGGGIPFTVTGADLVVDHLTVPSAVNAKGTLNFSYTLKNIGNSNADASSVKFFLKSIKYDSIIDLTEVSVASILAGASHSGSLSVTVPNNVNIGNYLLSAQVDSKGEVDEFSEINNDESKSITITGVDLVVDNLTTESQTANAGKTVNIKYNLKNNGNIAAGLSTIKYSLKSIKDGTVIELTNSEDSVSSISIGTTELESTIALPNNLSVGQYRLYAQVIKGSADVEIDESDNQDSFVMNVTIPEADLALGKLSTPTTLTLGKALNFKYSVKNLGDSAAEAFSIKYYLSKDNILDASDIYLRTSKSLSGINAGDKTDVATSVLLKKSWLKTALKQGGYYLLTEVDDGKVINESNETNNVLSLKLNVIHPDLVVNVSKLPKGNTAVAGENLKFSYSVKNKGKGIADKSVTKFYLSTDKKFDAKKDILLDSRSISAIQKGKSKAGNFSSRLSKNLAAGDYYLFAVGDSKDFLYESNERNNLAPVKKITITKPKGKGK